MKAVPELLVQHIRDEMGKVVVGQDELRTQCVVALLCRGHVLLEGVPGIAKTLTVKALSQLLRLGFQRVQCTSDLMPADIVGPTFSTWRPARSSCIGPGIHRSAARGRGEPHAAAYPGRIARVHGRTSGHDRRQRLSAFAFFTVFATQNPIEFEGTYPLPEAQLDRFLLKVRVTYPAMKDEVQLLANVQNGFESRELEKMNLTPIIPACSSGPAGMSR